MEVQWLPHCTLFQTTLEYQSTACLDCPAGIWPYARRVRRYVNQALLCSVHNQVHDSRVLQPKHHMASRSVNSSAPRTSQQQTSESYVSDPLAGNMLRFQASLPRLPVPPLSTTVRKYLDTVKPHLTDIEYTATKASAQAFLSSPQAAELQARLEARAADPSIKNWLADWWNEVAYMGYRDPVVVYVSYFYVHIDDQRRRDPAKRAAGLIRAMLPFRHLVES